MSHPTLSHRHAKIEALMLKSDGKGDVMFPFPISIMVRSFNAKVYKWHFLVVAILRANSLTKKGSHHRCLRVKIVKFLDDRFYRTLLGKYI